MSARNSGRWMLAAAVFFAGAAAWGDQIVLTSGEAYSGTISRQGDMMVIRTDDGKTITAKPDEIAAVTLNDSRTPAEAAASAWTKTGQQIKAADDLQTIIALHKKFLEKYPDVALAKEVRSSLEVYEQLAGDDGVKFRGRWIPRAQVSAMVRGWEDAARPAMDLYKAGTYKEALEAAKTALASDAQNPDALALAGLCAFRVNNMPQARTYFASLAAADPTSVLAENNLGVVAFVQKQPAEGLSHYTRALAIRPDNRLLLDNIEEAVNSYVTGGGDKNGTVYKALLRQFDPAEKKMEERMAKRENGGLLRWGGSWVTRVKLEALAAYQTQAQAQAAKLDSDYGTARGVLAGIENQLKQATADAESELQAVDYYSNQLAFNQPPLVVNSALLISQRDAAIQNMDRSQRFEAQLQTEHDQFLAGTRAYFAQAERVKGVLAAGAGAAGGGYSGVQRAMDVGEDENPPAPVAVADPPALPAVPELPPIVMAPAPVIVQVAAPVPAPVVTEVRHGN